MIFSSLRHWTSRCQLRHSKLSCFSTSPYRRLSGNPPNTFAEHLSLQSSLTNDVRDELVEGSQLEEPQIRSTNCDVRFHSPTYTERDATRAPAYADSIRSPQANKDHDIEEPGWRLAYDDASQATLGSSREIKQDMSSLDGLTVKQGEYIADAGKRLAEVIRNKDPQSLLLELWKATKEPAIMRAIPSSTFLEIARLLDPEDEKLRPQVGEIYQTIEDCRKLYGDIWEKRSQANQGMDVREYAAMLRLARSTWHAEGALAIMKNMLKRKVKPDLICYNYYFETRCWSDAWHPSERQRLRVIPFTQTLRQKSSVLESRGMTINGHSIGEYGLRAEVTRLFTKMIDDGIMADTAAFGHLMTAMAREGDMDGVKSILLRTWNVDVDALSDIGCETRTEKTIPRNSPLYPNSRLLFVLAHAFGSNNDLRAALRVVDHFSRKFDLVIPRNVWAQLLEWTFVLSTRRHKDREEEGTQLGRLQIQSVESLFNVMISDPYRVEPTLNMYDFLVRSCYRQTRLFGMLKYMPKGVQIHRKHEIDSRKHAALLSKLETRTLMDRNAKDVASIERLADVANTRRRQSSVTIQGWFKLLFSRRHWRLLDRDERLIFWERQGLPNAVKTYWRYRDGPSITYAMTTGILELQEAF
ncbi:hypothetical protein N7G274_000034 [Stereocaulon virgatum]|uniref:Pentatricopeptide repeat domain-containing protein n=1 Tax=Stereocaulon virgatum TaxID=373712 RepID=A0ABR4ASM6_9LECA